MAPPSTSTGGSTRVEDGGGGGGRLRRRWRAIWLAVGAALVVLLAYVMGDSLSDLQAEDEFDAETSDQAMRTYLNGVTCAGALVWPLVWHVTAQDAAG